MLRRLLLALLVLCLAAPAVAVPMHCLPAEQAGIPHESMQHPEMTDGHHTDHSSHHQDEAPAKTQPFAKKSHDCIGCGVPQPGTMAIREVMPYPAVPAIARDRTLALVGPARPETPPPRS